MVSSVLRVCAALLLVAAGQGCTWKSIRSTASQSTTADHVPSSALIIETRNGAVEVFADRTFDKVQVDAKLTCIGETQDEADARVARASINVYRDAAGALAIEPVFPDEARNGDGASIIVRLPGALHVTIETSNGPVVVDGTAGKLVIDTSNGPVRVNRHDGPAEIDTSNGKVAVAGVEGSLKIDTSNSPVDVSGAMGTTTISTSNGRIDVALDERQAGPLELRTSNGGISAKVGPAFTGAVSFDTSNSAVQITDPAGRVTSSRLDKSSGRIVIGEESNASIIETSNGRIEFEIAG